MPLHIPVIRVGETYRSLDALPLEDPSSGDVLALVSQANEAMVRRDAPRIGQASEALRQLSTSEMCAIAGRAGELFMQAELPLGAALRLPV